MFGGETNPFDIASVDDRWVFFKIKWVCWNDTNMLNYLMYNHDVLNAYEELVRAIVDKACVSILNCLIHVHVYIHTWTCMRQFIYIYIYIYIYIFVDEMSVLSWELVSLRLLKLVSSPPVWEVCAQEKFGRYVPKMDIVV